MKLFLLLLTLGLMIVRSDCFAQTAQLDSLKGEIAYYADISLNARVDKHRIRANSQMISGLDRFFNTDGSYQATLDSIPWLSVVKAEHFRVITWQLRISDEEYKYGGWIQWTDRLVQLKDTRPFINGAAYTTFTPSSWYGCVYYQIIPFERDNREYYTLLGYNAENSLINTKVADVLDIHGPDPQFGLPVFVGKEEPQSRILFTYADVSPARLDYDTELNGIVHDHLENFPGVGPEGEALPVPDGSLEAWLLKKGEWVYEAKVYDVKRKEPPFSNGRENRKEERDILGRPIKE